MIFQATLTTSITHNSTFHLSHHIGNFRFLMIFLGRITLFHWLKKHNKMLLTLHICINTFLCFRSMHMFTRPQRRVAALNHFTIIEEPSLIFNLNSMKLLITLFSWIIWNLVLSFHIIRIAFVARDLLVLFLLPFWSMVFCYYYGEYCAVALNISKAFHEICHASLFSNLLYFWFLPSLCLLLFGFL